MSSFIRPCIFQLIKVNGSKLNRYSVTSLNRTTAAFHTSSVSNIDESFSAFTEDERRAHLGLPRSTKWERYNKIIYPPQEEGDGIRPVEVTHARYNIKYSQLKMWYIAVMIRGMTIDEALKQVTFYKRKGAASVKEVLEEAQMLAVRDHNLEFKSNLWITDSFVGKGKVIKGVRRHARGRMSIVRHGYCHYYVRLQEGTPPKHYYPPPQTGHQKMEEYIGEQRSRRIIHGL